MVSVHEGRRCQKDAGEDVCLNVAGAGGTPRSGQCGEELSESKVCGGMPNETLVYGAMPIEALVCCRTLVRAAKGVIKPKMLCRTVRLRGK